MASALLNSIAQRYHLVNIFINTICRLFKELRRAICRSFKGKNEQQLKCHLAYLQLLSAAVDNTVDWPGQYINTTRQWGYLHARLESQTRPLMSDVCITVKHITTGIENNLSCKKCPHLNSFQDYLQCLVPSYFSICVNFNSQKEGKNVEVCSCICSCKQQQLYGLSLKRVHRYFYVFR